MKQLFAFSILFCLVFLNVPRTFVHDCDDHVHHQDAQHSVENDSHQNDDYLSFDIDNESCFICEFDLGYFNLMEANIPSFIAFYNYTFNEPSVEYVSPDEFNAFAHRAPPMS